MIALTSCLILAICRAGWNCCLTANGVCSLLNCISAFACQQSGWSVCFLSSVNIDLSAVTGVVGFRGRIGSLLGPHWWLFCGVGSPLFRRCNPVVVYFLFISSLLEPYLSEWYLAQGELRTSSQQALLMKMTNCFQVGYRLPSTDSLNDSEADSLALLFQFFYLTIRSSRFSYFKIQIVSQH